MLLGVHWYTEALYYSDAPKVLAAAVSSMDNGPRLALVRESPFLPSLGVRGLGA